MWKFQFPANPVAAIFGVSCSRSGASGYFTGDFGEFKELP
jgi:hypothetical protein